MALPEKFSILILVLSIGAQLANRSFFGKYIKLAFYSGFFAQFGSAFYLAFSQYETWKGSYFLPPYRSWSYFIFYVGSRVFVPLIVALLFAFILKFVCEFMNRRYHERFFEQEEGWLLALGVFLTGYPGLLVYIPLMLFAAFLLSVIYHFMKKGRTPLFYAWLPVAIFAILLESLIPQSALNFLVI